MSSDDRGQYLAPSEIEMIHRLLEAGLRKPPASPALSCEAAKLLIRNFQEGVTNESELRLVLDRYIWIWCGGWGPKPHLSNRGLHLTDDAYATSGDEHRLH
jgi:hypothetical protein